MHGVQSVDELIDLLLHGVQVEPRAIRRGDSELLHQRLAAVVSGADRHALHVENLGDVVRVDAVDVERHDAGAALGRWSVERDARDVGQPPQCVRRELVLVSLDRIEADAREIVDGRAEADRFRHRGRTGLELVRQLSPRRLLEADRVDHVTSGEERLHREQKLAAPPQRPDAARPAHLVGRDRDEVGAERLYVDVDVRRGLGGVADEDRTLLVRPRDELLHRVDRPERVRHLVRGDDLDVPLRRDTVERGEIELALLGERDHRELRSRTPRDVLPGNEVRVMLELADDDEVTGAKIVQAPRVRDEVDRLRRVSYEDDLAYVGRVQQGAHLLARALERGSRPFRKHVDAAVHVRVRRRIELGHRLHHPARLLRARGGVEEGERLAVDQLLEDGEVRANRAGVERLRPRGDSHGFHGIGGDYVWKEAPT